MSKHPAKPAPASSSAKPKPKPASKPKPKPQTVRVRRPRSASSFRRIKSLRVRLRKTERVLDLSEDILRAVGEAAAHLAALIAEAKAKGQPLSADTVIQVLKKISTTSLTQADLVEKFLSLGPGDDGGDDDMTQDVGDEDEEEEEEEEEEQPEEGEPDDNGS